jgi:hypothetical protein
VTRSRASRSAVKLWKRHHPFDPGQAAGFAEAVAGLIRAWSPVLPPGTIVTAPPQGASAPGPYAAFDLAVRVAEALGLPFLPILSRTDQKNWHGPLFSLKQAPYLCTPPDPAPTLVLVIDDLTTSGATLKLSLAAIRGAGIPAFGFAYSGC